MTSPDELGDILMPDLTWNFNENSYTRTPDEEYWSGFKGAKQWYVILDDLARERKNQIIQGNSLSLKEIITIVNSVGIATNQASLEDKGCIPLLPKLVVATTNQKDLHAHLAVNEPGAILRRFPFVIEPIVKPEFLDNDGQICTEGTNHNIWTFKVEKVVRRETEYVYEPVLSEDGELYMEGSEFANFICLQMQRFVRKQRKNELNINSDIQKCSHGIVRPYFPCHQCDEEEDEIVEFQAQAGIPDFIETSCGLLMWSWILFMDYFFGNLYFKFLFRNSLFGGYLARSPAFASIRKKIVYNRWKRRYLQCRRSIGLPDQMSSWISAIIWIISCVGIYGFFKLVSSLIFPKDSCIAQADIWQKNDSNEDFIIPKTSHPRNSNEIVTTLSKSMFRLNVESSDNGKVESVYCLCLKPGVYLTVSHVFRNGDKWKCVADLLKASYNARSIRGFILSREQIKVLPNDLCVFSTRNIPPRKPIYKFLPDKIDKAGRIGHQILWADMRSILVEVSTTSYGYSSYRTVDGQEFRGNFMHGYRKEGSPCSGDCGSPFISSSPFGDFISGIHVAGQPLSSSVVFSQISKEILGDLEDIALSGCGTFDSINKGTSSSGPLNTPNRKGIHHWITAPSCEVLGSYTGRHSPSSKVAYTQICESVKNAFNFKCEFGKPLMQPRLTSEGVWVNPFTIATNQQANISTHFEEPLVQLCKKHYLSHVGQVDLNFSVVSEEVAINGLPGVDFINRLPMSTSGGFFFPGPKKNYFSISQEEPFRIYIPNDEVRLRIDEIKRAYILGRRFNILFQGTLKDEPTKFKKILSGKTRVFTACDVAFSIVVRQQYLGITKFIMENNFRTECAVGMNCYSDIWQELHFYLTAFGEDRIIAGDYSAFDKNMPAIFILAAFDILDEWISRVDPSPENKLIRRGIATDIAFPIVNMNGDVFQFYGGNSSGHPLTVIVNSLVNSLYMRYAYVMLGLPLENFSKEVRLMTLGDDNIMGSLNPVFNHTSISNILAKHGVPYTMADKDSISVPFINIKDADFLKRSFRHVSGKIRAPLLEVSILKSLCVFLPKGNISEEEQIAQSSLAAIMEMVLHGSEKHKIFYDSLVRILEPFPDIKRFLHPRFHFTYEQWIEWFDDLENNLVDTDSSEEE